MTGTPTLWEAERRHILSEAAHDLLLLIDRCPEILRIVPIDDEDLQTLHELAYGDEENEYAPE